MSGAVEFDGNVVTKDLVKDIAASSVKRCASIFIGSIEFVHSFEKSVNLVLTISMESSRKNKLISQQFFVDADSSLLINLNCAFNLIYSHNVKVYRDPVLRIALENIKPKTFSRHRSLAACLVSMQQVVQADFEGQLIMNSTHTSERIPFAKVNAKIRSSYLEDTSGDEDSNSDQEFSGIHSDKRVSRNPFRLRSGPTASPRGLSLMSKFNSTSGTSDRGSDGMNDRGSSHSSTSRPPMNERVGIHSSTHALTITEDTHSSGKEGDGTSEQYSSTDGHSLTFLSPLQVNSLTRPSPGVGNNIYSQRDSGGSMDEVSGSYGGGSVEGEVHSFHHPPTHSVNGPSLNTQAPSSLHEYSGSSSVGMFSNTHSLDDSLIHTPFHPNKPSLSDVTLNDRVYDRGVSLWNPSSSQPSRPTGSLTSTAHSSSPPPLPPRSSDRSGVNRRVHEKDSPMSSINNNNNNNNSNISNSSNGSRGPARFVPIIRTLRSKFPKMDNLRKGGKQQQPTSLVQESNIGIDVSRVENRVNKAREPSIPLQESHDNYQMASTQSNYLPVAIVVDNDQQLDSFVRYLRLQSITHPPSEEKWDWSPYVFDTQQTDVLSVLRCVYAVYCERSLSSSSPALRVVMVGSDTFFHSVLTAFLLFMDEMPREPHNIQFIPLSISMTNPCPLQQWMSTTFESYCSLIQCLTSIFAVDDVDISNGLVSEAIYDYLSINSSSLLLPVSEVSLQMKSSDVQEVVAPPPPTPPLTRSLSHSNTKVGQSVNITAGSSSSVSSVGGSMSGGSATGDGSSTSSLHSHESKVTITKLERGKPVAGLTPIPDTDSLSVSSSQSLSQPSSRPATPLITQDQTPSTTSPPVLMKVSSRSLPVRRQQVSGASSLTFPGTILQDSSSTVVNGRKGDRVSSSEMGMMSAGDSEVLRANSSSYNSYLSLHSPQVSSSSLAHSSSSAQLTSALQPPPPPPPPPLSSSSSSATTTSATTATTTAVSKGSHLDTLLAENRSANNSSKSLTGLMSSNMNMQWSMSERGSDWPSQLVDDRVSNMFPSVSSSKSTPLTGIVLSNGDDACVHGILDRSNFKFTVPFIQQIRINASGVSVNDIPPLIHDSLPTSSIDNVDTAMLDRLRGNTTSSQRKNIPIPPFSSSHSVPSTPQVLSPYPHTAMAAGSTGAPGGVSSSSPSVPNTPLLYSPISPLTGASFAQTPTMSPSPAPVFMSAGLLPLLNADVDYWVRDFSSGAESANCLKHVELKSNKFMTHFVIRKVFPVEKNNSKTESESLPFQILLRTNVDSVSTKKRRNLITKCFLTPVVPVTNTPVSKNNTTKAPLWFEAKANKVLFTFKSKEMILVDGIGIPISDFCSVSNKWMSRTNRFPLSVPCNDDDTSDSLYAE